MTDQAPAATLTVADLNCTINHEPRVLDMVLAERLGMRNQRSIRELIEQNREELEQHGNLSAAPTNPGGKGGRPGRAFYLNEGQALAVCALSRTAVAAKVRTAIIKVYQAFRMGELQPTPTPRVTAVRPHQRRISGRAEDRDRLRVLIDRLEGVVGALPVPAARSIENPDPSFPGLTFREDGVAMVRADEHAPPPYKPGNELLVELKPRLWRAGDIVACFGPAADGYRSVCIRRLVRDENGRGVFGERTGHVDDFEHRKQHPHARDAWLNVLILGRVAGRVELPGGPRLPKIVEQLVA